MTAEPDRSQPSPGQPAGPDALGDPDLLSAVRAGDQDAFATLYTRHVEAARRLAMALTRSQADADDLVAEAFARLLTTLRGGGGPGVAFRAYLLTTLRNVFYSRLRRDRRVSPTDDLSGYDTAVPFEDPVVERLEQTLVARAFARLPERWQAVLWHTEVEGEAPARVAPLLDLTPNGVAVLAYRARERLRQNYLREHVTESPDGECRSTIDRLGGYVREGLSQRDRAAVAEHLAGCRRCQALYLELGDVNASLRGLLAPVVLGPAAAAAYLGPASAGGFTALLAPVWSGAKRISHRRSTQVGAAGSVMAVAALAVALILTSGPVPDLEAGGPLPPGTDPGPAGSEDSGPASGGPPPDDPAAGTGPGPAGSGGVDPARGAPGGPGAPESGRLPLAVALEPVGALVRDRPGVLALAVTALDPAGGTGGELAPAAMAASRAAGAAAETGPLTAVVTLPDGVALRAGTPGGGWTCTGGSGEIRCERPSLPAGRAAHAYLPVTVAATAAGAAPRVRLTGPGAEDGSATAARGVGSEGLSATFAGVLPATVVTGGNALLSCPQLDLTCSAARGGRGALGRTDNDDYLMTRYVSSGAPAGVPRRAAVSGATIQVPGEVVWAGLYWAGSGEPPRAPTAYLHIPGRAGYTTVAAATVRDVGGAAFDQTAYQASAVVTDLVRGSTGGQWWVAVGADAFRPGLGSFGGWALMIVAKDGGADRTVAVFEELTPLRDRRSLTAPVYGQPGSGRIGFIAWDGDRRAGGAQLRLEGAPVGGADQDNIAASLADGNPAGWNTLGTDARVLDTAVAAPGSAGPPTLIATASRRNPWLLGPIAVVTPAP